MNREKNYLAIDIGASSGKAICGTLKNGKMTLNEVSRFVNEPVLINGSLRWNILSLWTDVLNCISACLNQGFENISSVGIDTWGVDFIFLDEMGHVLQNPFHYRDEITSDVEKWIEDKIHEQDLYEITGLRIGRVTTLSQMVSLKMKLRWLFDVARTFLMMPDFFRYLLSGNIACELTNAGSSQLLDIRTKKWSKKIFDTFNLPLNIMPEIVYPGTIAGKLRKEISGKFHCKNTNVSVVAGHDTASAAAAVPFVDQNTLFISSGTWAVFGLISKFPQTDDRTFKAGFINEPGFDCILVVRNMAGLYLFENFYRRLFEKDRKITYRKMIESAMDSSGFQLFLNPNDHLFFSIENGEIALKKYCDSTGQKYPERMADILRAILEGIALSFKKPLEDIQACTGRTFEKICIVGGGVKNKLLCQMIADATGLQVITGPSEAAAVGNLCIQAFADGEIQDISRIRDMAASSCKVNIFQPKNTDRWEKQYQRFKHLYF
ncbi:MAG TPA: FGGY family carbohydrate kinase [bacterium]|nr:FGGY family carbohydrate kinase [bacterium]